MEKIGKKIRDISHQGTLVLGTLVHW